MNNSSNKTEEKTFKMEGPSNMVSDHRVQPEDGLFKPTKKSITIKESSKIVTFCQNVKRKAQILAKKFPGDSCLELTSSNFQIKSRPSDAQVNVPFDLNYAISTNNEIEERFNISQVYFLARGGFGTVYAASDSKINGKTYAIKSQSAKYLNEYALRYWVKNVKRETYLLHKLSIHPNIVKIYDIEWYDAPSWNTMPAHLLMKMEYLQMSLTNLKELAGGSFTFKQIGLIGRQIGSAIAYCHDKCIINHDIKPDNIMIACIDYSEIPSDICQQLDDEKNPVTYKIIDLGLARQFRMSRLDAAKSKEPLEIKFSGGTLNMMDPDKATLRAEQIKLFIKKSFNSKSITTGYNPYLSDSYSLGVSLFTMICNVTFPSFPKNYFMNGDVRYMLSYNDFIKKQYLEFQRKMLTQNENDDECCSGERKQFTHPQYLAAIGDMLIGNKNGQRIDIHQALKLFNILDEQPIEKYFRF